MDIRPLRNEADYDWALAEIESYFDQEPEPGSAEADHFELLALVIADYESKHWSIEAADPVEAIRYRMETQGLQQKDLAVLLGSRSRASELMSRRRPLTTDMIWKLHRHWGIPAESLIRPYELRRSA